MISNAPVQYSPLALAMQNPNFGQGQGGNPFQQLLAQSMANGGMQRVPGGAAAAQPGPLPVAHAPAAGGSGIGPQEPGVMYDPSGLNPSSLVPWLQQVFSIVGNNEPTIQAALKNHTASTLNHSLFGADASGLGLSLPGSDPNSKQLFDPFGLGEDSPFYAFKHLDLSPQQRQWLFNQVLGKSTDPFLQKVGQEFFALNPDDLNYYYNTSSGRTSGYTGNANPFGQ